MITCRVIIIINDPYSNKPSFARDNFDISLQPGVALTQNNSQDCLIVTLGGKDRHISKGPKVKDMDIFFVSIHNVIYTVHWI